MTIKPIKLTGTWTYGVALDRHTLDSTFVGHDGAGHPQFETRRSELGELLYQVKYQGKQRLVEQIAAAAVQFLGPHRDKIDIVVPMPPSGKRAVQPVPLIAAASGDSLGLPVIDCIETTRTTAELKGVDEPERRQELVRGLYRVTGDAIRRRNVLLFDDLYRSGTTLTAVTEVLMKAGDASSVRVLTVTKTRSNR